MKKVFPFPILLKIEKGGVNLFMGKKSDIGITGFLFGIVGKVR